MRRSLPEGEGIGVGAGIEEFNREDASLDLIFLTDQLVKPLVCNRPIALRIHVHTVIRPWRLAIERELRCVPDLPDFLRGIAPGDGL